MTHEYLLVIDAGTTGLRTIIYNLEGLEISKAYQEYSSIFPSPVMVEQNALDWWEAVKKTSKTALKSSDIKAEQVIAISVTNQRETIVPVSDNGDPLHNAIVWQDRRTLPECDLIREKMGIEKINEITGLTIDPYFSASKILWLKNHRPDVFKRTHKFLLVHDYLEMKLCGEFITDWSNASRTMLFDIAKTEWSKDICNELEIPIELLPDPVPSGKQVGIISKEAQGELSLPANIPIISGGGDQQCAAVGVGVVETGRVKITTGTGSFILAHLDDLIRDKKRRVVTSCHAVPGKYVLEASMFTTGSVLRYYRDTFGEAEKNAAKSKGLDPYEILISEAEEAPVGAGGVLVVPHFMGVGAPYWNSLSRGIIIGLTLGHDKKYVIRAIMEGISLEIRKNLEVFKELMKTPIQEVRITGGATRSDFWNQIQADVYGISVLKSQTEETTALGAAILASLGVGAYKNIHEASEKMTKLADKLDPNPKNKEIYHRIYKTHKKLYELLNEQGIYEELANFSS